MPRILVTGSRSWTDRKTLSWALTQTCIDHGWMVEPDEYGNTLPRGDVVVVHGGAQGADTMADDWVAGSIVRTEVYRYPSLLGNAGGPLRNRYMVGLGADVVLAFFDLDSRDRGRLSRGASNCVLEAVKFRIPVRRFYADRVPDWMRVG